MYFQHVGKAEKYLCSLTCYYVRSYRDQKYRKENDNLGIGLYGWAVEGQITVDYPLTSMLP